MFFHYLFDTNTVNPSVAAKNFPVNIQSLETQPQYFSQVAQWHHEECERQGISSTLSLRQQRLILHMQTTPVPKTLILLRGNQLLGCVSLVNYNYRSAERMPKVATDNPLWLSNLFVVETERHQGFGNLLVEAAKKYARDLGLQELWLSAAEYTDFYERRGWNIVRRTRLGGRQVNVMQIFFTFLIHRLIRASLACVKNNNFKVSHFSPLFLLPKRFLRRFVV